MTPRPISFYARQLRSELPDRLFDPVPARAAWAVFYALLVGVGFFAIARNFGGLPGRLAMSLLVGHSFAGLAFVGHETLHGSVVRGRGRLYALGFFCLLPFTVSPRLWIAWHNKVHHGHTMAQGLDPDAYPTLDEYRQSPLLRLVDRYSVARGHWAGWLTLLLGFSVQMSQILFKASRSPEYFTPGQRRWALVETALGVSFWAALGYWLGPVTFVFAYVIPLLVGNVIVTSYILTNHSLSPMTNTANDPLLNSLTVLVPKPLDVLHLSFGLHVEHHLFPAMSPRHAHKVRQILLRKWPDEYQSMSFWSAMLRLFSTPRIYQDEITLVDPRTGDTFPALLPRHSPTREEKGVSEKAGTADVVDRRTPAYLQVTDPG